MNPTVYRNLLQLNNSILNGCKKNLVTFEHELIRKSPLVSQRIYNIQIPRFSRSFSTNRVLLSNQPPIVPEKPFNPGQSSHESTTKGHFNRPNSSGILTGVLISCGVFAGFYVLHRSGLLERLAQKQNPTHETKEHLEDFAETQIGIDTLREQYEILKTNDGTSTSEEVIKNLAETLRKREKDGILTNTSVAAEKSLKAACYFCAVATLPLPDKYHPLCHYAAMCLLKACRKEVGFDKQKDLVAIIKSIDHFFANKNFDNISSLHLMLLSESFSLIMSKILESSLQRPLEIAEKNNLVNYAKRIKENTKDLFYPDLNYHVWCAESSAKSLKIKNIDNIDLATDAFTAVWRLINSKSFQEAVEAISTRSPKKGAAFLVKIIQDPKAIASELKAVFKDIDPHIEEALRTLSEEDQLYMLVNLTTLLGTQEEIYDVVEQLSQSLEEPSQQSRLEEASDSRRIPIQLKWQAAYILLELVDRLLAWPSANQAIEIANLFERLDKLIDCPDLIYETRYKLHKTLLLFRERSTQVSTGEVDALIKRNLEKINSLSLIDSFRIKKGLKTLSSETIRTFRHQAYQAMFQWSGMKMTNIPDRDQHFIPRNKDIGEIEQALKEKSTLLMYGLPGAGKTQLARDFARQNAFDYDRIYFLNARKTTTLEESLTEIANDFEINQDLASALRREMAKEELKKCKNILLVIDNCDTEDALKQIMQALPIGEEGIQTIITSRPEAQENKCIWKSIKCPEITMEQAIQYLLDTTGDKDREYAKQIAIKLGKLPLALASVAAYIHNSDLNLKEYFELLQQELIVLQEITAPIDGYKRTLHIVCQQILEAIEKQNPIAIELIRFLGTLNPDQIPVNPILKKWISLRKRSISNPGHTLTTAVADLKRYSLLERFDGICNVHAAYHEICSKDISKDISKPSSPRDPDPTPQSEDWKITLQIMNEQLGFYHQGDSTTWPAAEKLLPHCQRLIDYIPTNKLKNQEAVEFLCRVAKIKRMQIKGQEAENLYRQAISIQGELDQNENSFAVADIKYRLCRSLINQGKYDDSEKILREILSIQKERVSPSKSILDSIKECFGITSKPSINKNDVLKVIRTLLLLGDCLYQRGEYNESKKNLEEALQMYETIPVETSHKSTLIYKLGCIFLEQADYPQSEECFRKSLELYYEHRGKNTKAIRPIWIRYFLGLCLVAQQRFPEAEYTLRKAQKGGEEVYGKRMAHLVYHIQNAIGELNHAQGKYEEAETIFRNNLKMFEDENSYYRLKTRTLFLLGKTLLEQGLQCKEDKLKESKNLLTESEQRMKKIYRNNPDHQILRECTESRQKAVIARAEEKQRLANSNSQT